MQCKKIFCVMALVVAAGCSQGPPKKTITAEGAKNWNGARAGVMYNLAREQFESGNLEDCQKSLVKAAKLSPEHILIRLLAAKLAIEQGNLEVAELELNRCRELDPKNGEVEYLTGVIQQRWNKPEAALASYAKASEKNPNELAYLLANAEMLVVVDQRTAALDLLQKKLNFFENSPAIRDMVGQLLMQEAKYPEALAMLRQASALAPEENSIREHYGMALLYSKQHREAVAVFERLLKDEKYSTRADLLTALGECKLELGQPREARDNFEIAAQLQPNTASAWLNLAKAALQLNDLKRAEISLKKAMSIETKSADANLLMGYLRLQQSKLEDALASFKKASQLDSQDPVSLCMCGLVLEKMGQSSEAIRYYSTALKIKPNDELATSLLAKVQVE